MTLKAIQQMLFLYIILAFNSQAAAQQIPTQQPLYTTYNQIQQKPEKVARGWTLKQKQGKKGIYEVDDGLAFVVESYGRTAFHIQKRDGYPITNSIIYAKNAKTATISLFCDGTGAISMLDSLIAKLSRTSLLMWRYSLGEEYLVELQSNFLGGYIASGGRMNIANPFISAASTKITQSISDEFEARIKLKQSECADESCIRKCLMDKKWKEETLNKALRAGLDMSVQHLRIARGMLPRNRWDNASADRFYKKFSNGFAAAEFYASAWVRLNDHNLWEQIVRDIVPQFTTGLTGTYSDIFSKIISEVYQKLIANGRINRALNDAKKQAENTATKINNKFETHWDTTNPWSNASLYLNDLRKR